MSYPVYTVPAGDVLPVMFSSYAGSTGASATLTGLAVTDIEIYKDGSATQRASDAGYTLLDTDGIDFDTITGIHGFSIDTGDNTDAGFYTVGSWFHVVVSSVTVDSQTVNFIACAFRIVPAESSAGVPKVDVSHVGGTSQTAGDLAALITTVDGVVDTILVDTNELQGDWTNGGRLDLIIDDILADTAVIGAAGAGLTEAGGTGDHLTAIPWNAAWDAEVQSEVNDGLVAFWTSPATLVDLVWDEAIAGHLSAGTTGLALNNASSAGDPWSTAIPGAYGAGTAGNIVGNYLTGDIYARLGAPAGASVSADIAAIKSDTAAILIDTAEIGSAGAGLTSLVDLVWDEVITGAFHNVANSAARFLRESSEAIGVSGTAQAGASTTITLAAAASATNDIYVGERIVIIEGTGAGQSRLISAYNGTTKVATVARAWTTNPSSDSLYVIQGADADVGAISGDITAADNAESFFDGTGYAGTGNVIPTVTDLTNKGDGSGFTAIPWNASWDAEVQSEAEDALIAHNLDHLVKSAVDTDFATTVHLDSVIGHLADVGTVATFSRTTDSLEALSGLVTTVDTVVDGIKTVTDALPDSGALTSIATAAALTTVDTVVDAIKVKTDQMVFTTANQLDCTTITMATGSVSAAALAADAGNEIADAILDRNMATGTDSGSPTVRTPRQAWRILRNKTAIAAGTLTVNKEDDTTASWTATVATSASDPISSIDPADA